MRIRSMTRTDLPACVSLSCDSFIDDSFFAVLCPFRHQHPEAWRRFHVERLRNRLMQPGIWCLVCVEDVEETGGQTKEEIIGIACWRRISTTPSAHSNSRYLYSNSGLFSEMERTLSAWEGAYNHHMRLNPAINRTLIGKMRNGHPQNVFGTLQDRWLLGTLNVGPKHQRKGAGGILVQWGLDRCREEGEALGLPPLPAVLIASPSGQGLYAKMGFKVVGWSGADMGIEEEYAVMVWDIAGLWTTPVEPGDSILSRTEHPIEVRFRGKEDTGVVSAPGEGQSSHLAVTIKDEAEAVITSSARSSQEAIATAAAKRIP